MNLTLPVDDAARTKVREQIASLLADAPHAQHILIEIEHSGSHARTSTGFVVRYDPAKLELERHGFGTDLEQALGLAELRASEQVRLAAPADPAETARLVLALLDSGVAHDLGVSIIGNRFEPEGDWLVGWGTAERIHEIEHGPELTPLLRRVLATVCAFPEEHDRSGG